MSSVERIAGRDRGQTVWPIPGISGTVMLEEVSDPLAFVGIDRWASKDSLPASGNSSVRTTNISISSATTSLMKEGLLGSFTTRRPGMSWWTM